MTCRRSDRRKRPRGAAALTAEELRDLLGKVRASDYCKQEDLVDAITVLIATGLRRSELLGLRWRDFDPKAGTLTVTGKVVRVKGQGLMRLDETKSAAGRRTIPIPKFAIEALQQRRALPYLGEQDVIFPSMAGTLRDPNNFATRWRRACDELGISDVTTHSFRKSDPHRRRGPVRPDRGRSSWAQSCVHDTGPLYGTREGPHRGRRPAGPLHK